MDGPAPRIIVSGASGQLGGLVVEELLARGVQPADLILVSRTPERLQQYAELGASTRFGDFLQPESLETAYEGGDRMLLISLDSDNPDPEVPARRVELQQIAIDAAIAAGVEHIVYTSIVDADASVSPIAVWHRATEADLRESGVTWTALRNQWYADGLVNQAARMVADRRVMVLPDDPGTAFVTRRDCAAAAAVALMTPGHENRVYEITGPALVRVRDLAAIASEITGIEIEVVEAGPQDEVTGPRPSGTTLTTHFRDITGEPGTTARDLLEANRDVLLEARRGESR
jgi:NAD(P)H dehydrogenase (quinone)